MTPRKRFKVGAWAAARGFCALKRVVVGFGIKGHAEARGLLFWDLTSESLPPEYSALDLAQERPNRPGAFYAAFGCEGPKLTVLIALS